MYTRLMAILCLVPAVSGCGIEEAGKSVEKAASSLEKTGGHIVETGKSLESGMKGFKPDLTDADDVRADQKKIAELEKEVERLKAQPQFPELSDVITERFAVGLPDGPPGVHSIIDGDLNSQVHRIDPVTMTTRDFGKQILRVEKVDWRLPGKANGRDHLQADVFVKEGTKLVFYFQVRNTFDGQPIRYPDTDKKPFDLSVRVYYRE